MHAHLHSLNTGHKCLKNLQGSFQEDKKTPLLTLFLRGAVKKVLAGKTYSN